MSEQLKLKERMEAAAVAAKPVIDVTKQFASDGLAVTKDAAQQAVAKARELNEKYQIVDKSKARSESLCRGRNRLRAGATG